MSLEAGHKFAHYEIVEPIGKGGMGEVYRATDAKLGRDIAIKVLPEAFAEDDERLKRFQREAKVLASLNHPNIAAIYGLEESGGTHYLVLELVPGETLAERIARGPIPFDEAKDIAIKIAEALEDAHEHGIVHRDLKPANIKLTPDGKVKVLDFGLAKAFAEESPDADGSMSPTITRDATRMGVILGTAAYMSPEQAKGKPVDKRADNFAFGAVLFEMLTGKKAFPGDDVSEVLASVIKLEPDWALLPRDMPPRVGVVLRRCLMKDVKRRLRDIADARFEIEDGTIDEPAVSSGRTSHSKWWRAAGVGATVIAFTAGLLWPTSTTPPEIERFIVPVDPALEIGQSEIAISPDGRDIVFSASRVGEWQLFRRARGELEPTPIPGSEGGAAAFFSPRGDELGFYTASGELMKMSWPPRGAPVRLSDNASWIGANATWSEDDTIVFTAGAQLMRISASGGVPEPITTPSGDGSFHAWPQLLPNGRWILYTDSPGPGSGDLVVASSETGEGRKLVENAFRAKYVPPGHVLYISEGALWATPFDAEAGSLRGSAFRIVDDVVRYRVGDDGTLAYVQGIELERNRLVWVSRSGVETSALADAQAFRRPRLSPDGRYVAVEIRSVTMQGDLWIYDLETGTRTRLTFGEYNTDPVWNPNGTHVTYATGPAVSNGIVQRAIDVRGETETLVDMLAAYAHSWSPDGKVLAFYAHDDGGAGPRSIWTLNLDDEAEPRPFLRTAFEERSPSFSPSGRFIAYTSNESGEDQIYIQAFPGPGAKIAVSRVGGHEPAWSQDGTELFFRRGGAVWAARVRHGSRLEVSEPSLLFDGPYVSGAGGTGGSQTYDVAPDGRFLMVKRDESPTGRLVVVRNWTEELKRLVQTDR